MTRHLVYLAVLSVLLSGCIIVDERERIHDDRAAAYVPDEAREPVRVLRHVVLLRFREGTGAEDIRRIENAFIALPGRIDAVYDFEWGTDVSVENLQKGYTHCFVVTFLNEAARARYLPHPAHEEFGSLLKPYLEEVLVIDYWTR